MLNNPILMHFVAVSVYGRHWFKWLIEVRLQLDLIMSTLSSLRHILLSKVGLIW